MTLRHQLPQVHVVSHHVTKIIMLFLKRNSSILGSRTAGPTRKGHLGRPSLAGRPNTSPQIGLKRAARLMVITGACSARRMSTMTHPLRLPLRVRHIANAVMML